MNLQQLEHLLAVLETGSFSRAAEQVHLTQPALSRSIQALEEEVGAALVERRGRRKEATEIGALVAARARRIRLELAELKRSADVLAGFETGSVRLGLGPAPAAVLSVPLMRHVLVHLPRIRLALSGGPPEAQLQALRARQVDALVVHKRFVPAHHDLRVELLPEMRLGFLCRPGHPLLAFERLSFARLRQYPLAATGIGMSEDVVQKLDAYFGGTVRFPDAVQLQSEEISCLVDIVKTSDAVFFGVLHAAREDQARGELVELPARPPLKLTSQFAFITLDGATLPAAVRAVREFCVASLRDAPLESADQASAR